MPPVASIRDWSLPALIKHQALQKAVACAMLRVAIAPRGSPYRANQIQAAVLSIFKGTRISKQALSNEDVVDAISMIWALTPFDEKEIQVKPRSHFHFPRGSQVLLT
jgi:hypothetical protein